MIEAVVERAMERVMVRHSKSSQGTAEMLKIPDAAKLANVSDATIRRWLDEGLLGRYGSARVVRVRRDEILSVKPKSGEHRAPSDVIASLLNKGSR